MKFNIGILSCILFLYSCNNSELKNKIIEQQEKLNAQNKTIDSLKTLVLSIEVELKEKSVKLQIKDSLIDEIVRSVEERFYLKGNHGKYDNNSNVKDGTGYEIINGKKFSSTPVSIDNLLSSSVSGIQVSSPPDYIDPEYASKYDFPIYPGQDAEETKKINNKIRVLDWLLKN